MLTCLSVLDTVLDVSVKTRLIGRVAEASLYFYDARMSFIGKLKQLIAKL